MAGNADTDGRADAMSRADRKAPETPTAPKEPAPTYQRTEAEQKVITAFFARQKAAPHFPALKIEIGVDKVANLSSAHVDESTARGLQCVALGITQNSEFSGLIRSAMELTTRDNDVDGILLNEFLAMVVGIGPTNPLEAMLATQMAAVHFAAVGSARRFRDADTLERRALAGKSLNNLTRTFAAQAETLKKLRSTGEQKVVVEHQHIHVYPGGQAVVGTVNQGEGGGGTEKIEHQSHERDQLLLSERLAVPGAIETNGMPLSGTGDEGPDCVPVPRGKGRGALRAV